MSAVDSEQALDVMSPPPRYGVDAEGAFNRVEKIRPPTITYGIKKR